MSTKNNEVLVLSYIYLAIAVMAEVIATSSLKASEEFTRFWPTALVVSSYIVAFYFLMLSLRSLPVGIAYAIWCGFGIILIAVIGWVVYGQKLDIPAILGMAMILSGILIIHLFSDAA